LLFNNKALYTSFIVRFHISIPAKAGISSFQTTLVILAKARTSYDRYSPLFGVLTEPGTIISLLGDNTNQRERKVKKRLSQRRRDTKNIIKIR
jgi:hypothetical protein